MKQIKQLLIGLFLLVVSVISLLPFWLMFSMSTYKSEMTMKRPLPTLWPRQS